MEKFPAERNEHPPRNLFTHKQETVDAMASIEGRGWARSTMETASLYSVRGALEYYEKNKEHYNAMGGPVSQAPIFTIYGGGGDNRWFVMRDGSVEFSEYHATAPGDIQKAKDLGFKTR